MASVDLIRSCLDSIRQIGEEVADAVIYLDAGCLEAFQFVGAFHLLLELGARSVCSLESMSPLDVIPSWHGTFMDVARKIVIITSHLLSDAHRYILRCLSTHQTVTHCTILTAISEIAHSAYADSPLGPDAFHEYESLLLQDYEELVLKREKKSSHQQNKMKMSAIDGTPVKMDPENSWSHLDSSGHCDVNAEARATGKLYDDDDSISCLKEDDSARLLISVHHFPMVMCPLSPQVFILPSEGAVAEACLSTNREDSLSPGLPSISTGFHSDGDDVPPGVTLTAHFLYHLAAKMDLKMDIFSLGDASKVIGKMLTDMSSLYDVGRRNKRSAGLLLIDRTLDLLTPCCHGDSFLDRLLSTFPHTDKITSSVSTKSSQTVKRNPLNMKVQFERVFSKEEPAMSKIQLSESIESFMSGWDSTEVDPEVADLADHTDSANKNASKCESFFSGTLLSNYNGTRYMETLLNRRANDGAILIKSWLLEALKNEKIAVNTKGRLGFTSASEIHALATKLASNSASLIRNRAIIQFALAAEIALSEPKSSRWDAFVSAERILNITSTDTSQSLSSQIHDLINTSMLVRSSKDKSTGSSQVFSFKDALLLTMTGYILAGENFPTSGSSGPFSWQEERSLKEAVVDAILEKPISAMVRFFHGLEKEQQANSRNEELAKHEDEDIDEWGNWDDDDTDDHNEQAYGDMQLKLELQDRVNQLFEFFHKLSGLKWKSPTLREAQLVTSNNFGNDTYTRKGLIHKLLMTALTKHDIPGLEYHSSAVGRFLKTGLGRFGLGQAKPNFGDQSVLLVFVVGGLSTLEVREAVEAVSECNRPESELILGGTTLLTPDDMFGLLLGSSD